MIGSEKKNPSPVKLGVLSFPDWDSRPSLFSPFVFKQNCCKID